MRENAQSNLNNRQAAQLAAGKILRWGVSNLDTTDLQELVAAQGTTCATDQVPYNLTWRRSQ
jgi:diketogulonate reductase-like aldo/keto reductase